jgi:hypothetical protein
MAKRKYSIGGQMKTAEEMTVEEKTQKLRECFSKVFSSFRKI